MKLPKEKFTLEEKIRILEEGLDPEINKSLESVGIEGPVMNLPKEKFTLEEKIRLLKEGLNPETNPSLESVFIDLSNPYRSGQLESNHLPTKPVKASG